MPDLADHDSEYVLASSLTGASDSVGDGKQPDHHIGTRFGAVHKASEQQTTGQEELRRTWHSGSDPEDQRRGRRK